MLDLPRWVTLNRREFERQFALPAVEPKETLIRAKKGTEFVSVPAARIHPSPA
ncbi:MAG: hypothetical protein LUO91_04625 [Methanomicrobiales archaeon]|jgi:hypothetical protein|nr:hypothetical protein [Methanomicrobiales archaeon]